MAIRTRVACLAVQKNKIVLMKKLISSYFNYNQLTPPGGGVELHETLEAACIREMYEETGLTVMEPVLRGVISYINYSNDDHAVTSLFLTDRVYGELVTKEPEKHIPEWVDLQTIRQNELVPEYYNEFIRVILSGEPFINARLEWNKPGTGVHFTWSIV